MNMSGASYRAGPSDPRNFGAPAPPMRSPPDSRGGPIPPHMSPHAMSKHPAMQQQRGSPTSKRPLSPGPAAEQTPTTHPSWHSG